MGLHAFVHAAFSGLDLHLRRKPRFYAALFALSIAVALFVLVVPPSGFPRSSSFVVPEGASFRSVAESLEEGGYVRSSLILRMLARATGADDAVHAGEYRFQEPIGLAELLSRLSRGDSGIPSYSVTFPEGITVREMSAILEKAVPGFDGAAFREAATPYEGYLFPDTYRVNENATPESVIALMRSTFDMKKATLEREQNISPHAFTDAVIMASLLEKEGRTADERRIIAGILWDRIDIGMPLQVDAVFGYIKGIDTYHPSGEDLLLPSPYNTYENRGLPPGPIGNPGLDALRAALLPEDTEYLYYLTGTDGITRYARTFEEHKENKERYLR